MEVKSSQSVKVLTPRIIKGLQATLHGRAVTPADQEYDSARSVWNGMINRHPALIVRCADTSDVVQAVHFAREQNLIIAVRGGGHGIPGYATVDYGMVIDLGLMKELIIDGQRQTALAGAGIKLGEFIRGIESYGLLTTVGTDGDTGLAGLTLGGGLGSLMGKFGLACDNALSFDMVTANGEILHASPDDNPDLYWGLRGGGGNFGIVTTFEFQLHPARSVLGGLIAYPLNRAREVMQFYRDFNTQVPDELTVFCSLQNNPQGQPMVGFLVCYTGDVQEGQRAVEPLRKLGTPALDSVNETLYSNFLGWGEMPRGDSYYGKGATITELTDEVIDYFIDAAMKRTSPLNHILIQHMHGAAARVAADATAFAARGNYYMPFILSQWVNGGGQEHIEWARNTWASVQPYSIEAGYVNFLGNDSQKNLTGAYGGNYKRLVDLKRRYDPENIFRLNGNIRPD